MEKPEQQAEEGAGGSRFGDFALTRLNESQLAERGFERLSDAQRTALPGLVAGRNALVLAPSGTGRTALAAIMAVERVDRDQTGLQAVLLVLTPDTVVETAAEVARVGGWPESAVLAVQPGLRADRVGAALRKGAVVAVGTPARVLDLVQREALSLQMVTFIAVLEADLMLQLEGEASLERLVALAPPSAQRMIGAAQSTERLQALAHSLGISRQEPLGSTTFLQWTTVREHALEVAEDEKLDLLATLCARAQAEGQETVVMARSAVWKRWVEEGLAWRGVQGCRVKEEGDQATAPVEESGRRGGRRGPSPQSLVWYHVPLQPGAWGGAGQAAGTILVTPAEYWDLVRLTREASVSAVEEPTDELAPAAEIPAPEIPEAKVSTVAPEEAAATPTPELKPREAGEAPGGPEEVEVAVPGAPPGEEGPPEVERNEAGAETTTEEEAAAEPGRAGSAGGKRRREGPRDDGLTEAERVARRHIKRDVARKIECIDPEDAAREAERLVRESVTESIYEQVFVDDMPPAAPEAERGGEQEEAARRRRLEIAARLDEARRQLAVNGLRAEMAQESVAGEEPVVPQPVVPEPTMEREPLTPEEERQVAFAQRALAMVSGWLRAEQDVPVVHRALADRLLQDRGAGDVIAVLLHHLLPATPCAPATPPPVTTVEEEEGGVARLFISLGRQAGMNQLQLLRLVEQMSGVPEADLGRADVLARYSFLEVKAQAADKVIAEMNGKRYRGREIAVDRAKPPRTA